MPRRVGSARVLSRRANDWVRARLSAPDDIGAHAHHDETGKVEEHALVGEVGGHDGQLPVGRDARHEPRQQVADVALEAGELGPLGAARQLVALVGAHRLDVAPPVALPRRADRAPHRFEQGGVVATQPRRAPEPGQAIEDDAAVGGALRRQRQRGLWLRGQRVELGEQPAEVEREELVAGVGEDEQLEEAETR